MIEQTYTLEMIPGGGPVVVPVSQYDTESRKLRFYLYAGGVKYTIPEGCKVWCDGTKSDGKGFSVEAEAGEMYVDVVPVAGMTAVAGPVECQITVTKDGAVLGSANFILQVERSALEAGTSLDPSVRTRLTTTPCAILPLEALAAGLTLPGSVSDSGVAARALWTQVQDLLGAGVPVVTPAEMDGQTLELFAEAAYQDSIGYHIRYAAIRPEGKELRPLVTISDVPPDQAAATTLTVASKGLGYTLTIAELEALGVAVSGVWRIVVNAPEAELRLVGQETTQVNADPALSISGHTTFTFGSQAAPTGDFSSLDKLAVTVPAGATPSVVFHSADLSQSAVTAALIPASLASWSGTQAQYDALSSYDSGTVYYILEAEA